MSKINQCIQDMIDHGVVEVSDIRLVVNPYYRYERTDEAYESCHPWPYSHISSPQGKTLLEAMVQDYMTMH